MRVSSHSTGAVHADLGVPDDRPGPDPVGQDRHAEPGGRHRPDGVDPGGEGVDHDRRRPGGDRRRRPVHAACRRARRRWRRRAPAGPPRPERRPPPDPLGQRAPVRVGQQLVVLHEVAPAPGQRRRRRRHLGRAQAQRRLDDPAQQRPGLPASGAEPGPSGPNPSSPNRGPPPRAATSSSGHSRATSRQRVNRAVSHPSPTRIEAISCGRLAPPVPPRPGDDRPPALLRQHLAAHPGPHLGRDRLRPGRLLHRQRPGRPRPAPARRSPPCDEGGRRSCAALRDNLCRCCQVRRAAGPSTEA